MFMRHLTEGRPRLAFPRPARSISPSCSRRSVARLTFCSVTAGLLSSAPAHFPMLLLLAQHSLFWSAKTLIAARIAHCRPLSIFGAFASYIVCIRVSALCRPACALVAAVSAVAPSMMAACSAHFAPVPLAWAFHASRPSVIKTGSGSPNEAPGCGAASMFMMLCSSWMGAGWVFEARN